LNLSKWKPELLAYWQNFQAQPPVIAVDPLAALLPADSQVVNGQEDIGNQGPDLLWTWWHFLHTTIITQLGGI